MLNCPQDHFQLKFQNAANPILNQQKKKGLLTLKC